MSDFMQRQITGKQTWLRVETTVGTEFVPADLVGFVRNSEQVSQPLTDSERARYEKMIRPYTEGTIESWENIMGCGARLSAPGYLDCTEWSVFDTEDEARAYLDEYYPEDEEESEQCAC
jgi:hypothetical protein